METRYPLRFTLAAITLFSLGSIPDIASAAIQRLKFQSQDRYLKVEVLADDLVHLEYGAGGGPAADEPIASSGLVCAAGDGVPAVVCKTDYSGPSAFTHDGNRLETAELRLEIDPQGLLVSLFDKTKNDALLTTLTPAGLDGAVKTLSATRGPQLDVYGLGQQFMEPGNTDIEWDGRVRQGGPFGNVMGNFNGGADGNTQIPILYAVNGASYENYALFLDNTYRQRWDFTATSQWQVEVSGGPLRLYLMTGPDLADLRGDYMDLVGHTLVPPKKMFGLWVSEYGFDDWGELDSKLTTLRANGFPLDGFVLDLQWFGGIKAGSDDTRMGSLSFDLIHFPDPQDKIAQLRADEGVGIMLIEEAYVGRALPEHADLHGRGCLAQACPGCSDAAYLTGNSWWGTGGMIDYTNPGCGAYIHDHKRQDLIAKGVIGHWTDLGEPEMYDPGSGYAAGDQAAAHNVFNARWIRSIYDGYQRNQVAQRPFMMSRSGNAGIQRFGAAMWSGDIGSKLENLASHGANQMHMSFSGIDYYGSDIGGFHRGDVQGDTARKNDLYTRWYAAGMLLDIPGRPHTENLCNCKETAPDRIGILQSNLANTRLRYALSPYLYSLAHRAYLYGEAVLPPLVMYYQTDDQVRGRGREKLLGRDLLTSLATEYGADHSSVYLPQGHWIDWYSLRPVDSQGVVVPDVPLWRDGLFRLPLYAREGAVIPLLAVDDQTMNVEGKRSDGSAEPPLTARVFAFGSGRDGSAAFTLYEDDGVSNAYQQGALRTTDISQERNANQVAVQVAAASGSYAGAPDSRANVVELVVDRPVVAVTLDGQPLEQLASEAALAGAASGWIKAGGLVVAKSPRLPVTAAKGFVFDLGEPSCTSELASVSIPGAGNGWNPADPQRTFQRDACDGKVWSAEVTLCNEEYKFAANGAWKLNWGCDGSQNGPNCPPQVSGIYRVSFDEEHPAQPQFERLGDAPGCRGAAAMFRCENGHTSFGTSVYVVGNIPELGEWSPEGALALSPNGPYPTWTGRIDNLPTDQAIEWKCIKRLEQGDRHVVQWQGGANNRYNPGSEVQTGAF